MLATLHSTSAQFSLWCPILRHWVLVPWLQLPLVSGHWHVTVSNLNSVVHWWICFTGLPALCWWLWHAWWYQHRWLVGLHIQEWLRIDSASLLPGISQGRSLMEPSSGSWCFPSVYYFDYIGTFLYCWPLLTSPVGQRVVPLYHYWRNEFCCAWIGP